MDKLIKKKGLKYKKLLLPLLVVSVSLATLALFLSGSDAPTVDINSIIISKVERGKFVKQISGTGRLVANQRRVLSTGGSALVEKIVRLPGAEVTHGDIIVEMSNPQLVQSYLESELEYESTLSEHESLLAQMASDKLNLQSEFSKIELQYLSTSLRLESEKILMEKGIIAALNYKLTELSNQKLKEMLELEKNRLIRFETFSKARMSSSETKLRQFKEIVKLRKTQVDNLIVRSSIDGVVQQVYVKEGQQVLAGEAISSVINKYDLKAEIKVAETQVRDIAIGNPVLVDMRTAMIKGIVDRIDPAVELGTITIDVRIIDELPSTARPDQSVFGIIEVKTKENVLFIDRPSLSKEGGDIVLYKMNENDKFASVQKVKLGEISYSKAEVISGLSENDFVIVSDLGSFNNVETLKIKN